MSRIAYFAAVIAMAVAADQLCTYEDGSARIDGFHPVDDSCTRFFECIDGSSPMDVMECAEGDMFVVGSIVERDGKDYQPGACVEQKEGMACQTRTRRQAVDEATTAAPNATAAPVRMRRQAVDVETTTANATDAAIVNLMRMRRQAIEEATAAPNKTENAEEKRVRRQAVDMAVLIEALQNMTTSTKAPVVKRQAVDSTVAPAVNETTAAANVRTRRAIDIEAEMQKIIEALQEQLNTTSTKAPITKRQTAEAIGPLPVGSQIVTAKTNETEKEDSDKKMRMRRQAIEVETTTAANQTDKVDGKRVRRQAVDMAVLIEALQNMTTSTKAPVVKRQAVESSTAAADNQTDATVVRMRRSIDAEMEKIIETLKEQLNISSTKAPITKRQAVESVMGMDEVVNATTSAPSGGIFKRAVDSVAEMMASIMGNETSTKAAITKRQVEEMTTLNLTTPATSRARRSVIETTADDVVNATTEAARTKRQTSVCASVPLNGLYVVDSPACRQFVQCKDGANVLADGLVMECAEGMMFVRAGMTKLDDGTYFMDAECLPYDDDLCKAILAEL